MCLEGDGERGNVGNTGCTLFDFNGDGQSEIVYRDEKFIYIINGTNGAVFTQQPCVPVPTANIQSWLTWMQTEYELCVRVVRWISYKMEQSLIRQIPTIWSQTNQTSATSTMQNSRRYEYSDRVLNLGSRSTCLESTRLLQCERK